MEEIRRRCDDSCIEITQHILMRFQQRNITYTYEEIKEVIRNVEIIEEYPTDYPYPSCLVLGRTMNRRILHVVIGAIEDKIWLVTVYEPDAEKWDRQFKCRKE